MIHEFGAGQNLQDKRKYIRLTMIYKIINKITYVPKI